MQFLDCQEPKPDSETTGYPVQRDIQYIPTFNLTIAKSLLCLFIYLIGSYSGIPAACHNVHQVHSDISSSRAGLWPDRSPTKTACSSPCSWRSDGTSAWTQEWNGESWALRVSLLRWCAIRPQTDSGMLQQSLSLHASYYVFALVYFLVSMFLVKSL